MGRAEVHAEMKEMLTARSFRVAGLWLELLLERAEG